MDAPATEIIDASTDRPWLASYPAGVPAQLSPSAYRNLPELLADCCARYAHRPAFLNFGVALNYSDLDRLSAAFAAFLQQRLQLVPGTRLAIMLPNLLQYPVVLYGALRAGLTVVSTNPLYTARELAHQLADSGAEAIVVLEQFAHVVAAAKSAAPALRTVILTRVGDLLPWPKSTLINFVLRHVKKAVPKYELPQALWLRKTLQQGARLRPLPVALEPHDLAFLQYTGGTTGVSKGAMLTHGNMLANIAQARAWLAPVVKEGEEIIVTALPLYHIFSLTANCFLFMALGGENVLVTNPRDLPRFVKILRGVRFTAITGVNTLFNALLHAPGFERVNCSRLKISLGGGMAVQPAVAARWKEITGCTLTEAYGLTETSPAVCINPLDLPAHNGAIGLPVPGTECRIVSEAGQVLPAGQAGELQVRGPQVMQGYWHQPEETARVLDADGWFATGDVAVMDERGFFRIVDRKKDMILVSGFNVYPNEIEAAAAEHPGVREAAAVGVADEHSGEAVKLFVVKNDDALDADALYHFLAERLTHYKRPRQIEFCAELPKNNVGKILRRALRNPVH